MSVAVLTTGLKTEYLDSASVSELELVHLMAECVPLLRYDHADAVWAAVATALESSCLASTTADTILSGAGGARYCLVGCVQRLVQALTVPMGDDVVDWWGPEMRGRIISFDMIATFDDEMRVEASKVYAGEAAQDGDTSGALAELRRRIWLEYVVVRGQDRAIVAPLALRALVWLRDALLMLE